eukprot:TRINITY_DN17058_c0_g1_i1.p4 TRINITY_DN17058_c0_g1~~TRINITY_DN17058_c0_g1_i1.p4  ORF type:complete len:165 (-),score=0.89 TRINITY_DN17058_c0_g1_i1:517-1011(-)
MLNKKPSTFYLKVLEINAINKMYKTVLCGFFFSCLQATVILESSSSSFSIFCSNIPIFALKLQYNSEYFTNYIFNCALLKHNEKNNHKNSFLNCICIKSKYQYYCFIIAQTWSEWKCGSWAVELLNVCAPTNRIVNFMEQFHKNFELLLQMCFQNSSQQKQLIS